jgi:hypothetical protein
MFQVTVKIGACKKELEIKHFGEGFLNIYLYIMDVWDLLWLSGMYESRRSCIGDDYTIRTSILHVEYHSFGALGSRGSATWPIPFHGELLASF